MTNRFKIVYRAKISNTDETFITQIYRSTLEDTYEIAQKLNAIYIYDRLNEWKWTFNNG